MGASQDSKIELKNEVIDYAFKRAPWQNRLETVLVGDTHFDAEGAKKSGITCIGVSYGFGTVEELLEAGAVAVLDSPSEVARYVKER